MSKIEHTLTSAQVFMVKLLLNTYIGIFHAVAQYIENAACIKANIFLAS